MLHLHHGNRLETLLDRLAEITAPPLADVFAAERIVVQNPGMSRWLAQGLAERHGIAANIDYTLPASFVWDTFRGQFEAVPEQSAFSPEALTWRIFAGLPALLDTPAFAELRRYLRDDGDGRKRLQLASRIAALFDQYLIYRADLILAWERGAEAGEWQAVLWRTLTAQLGRRHRAALLQELAQRPGGLDASALPERVCLFGITALAPSYLDVFRAIASHVEVHVFLLSPSFQWWADQLSERDLARRRDAARQLGVMDSAINAGTDGNPLLASLARQGREFLDALHEQVDSDNPHYAPPEQLNLLGTLQLDLLFMQHRGSNDGQARMPVAEDDASLQIHRCHSAIREVQVLHDHLLELFERLPGLHARDIVVMAPEIGRYAPLIDAVFGGVPEDRRIPWSIADISGNDGDEPLIRSFLALLQLPQDRHALGTVLNWLQVPAFARRCGLGDDALPRIEQWLRAAGVRWGRDGAHRAELGIVAEDTHSWAFGLRRLLLGYAVNDDRTRIASVAPYPDIEGQEAVWLGNLAELIDRLGRWASELGKPATPAEWLQTLPRLLNAFFDFGTEDEGGEARIRSALHQWWEQLDAASLGDASIPLSNAVVHAHLRTALETQTASHRFLNGAVSFCNMVPMRSIPFRVVCLLGMNDTDYPRTQPQLSFDRIAAKPRKGDRSRRDDDRTLFLEALLSARDSLYISYIGNDARDDSPRNPSVLVSELLETVESGFELPRQPFVSRHPLQAFSTDNFHPPYFSYAGEWLPAPIAPTPLFPAGGEFTVPENHDDSAITLDALHAFFRDPVDHFLRESLGLRLFAEDVRPADAEDFTLDGLQSWTLRNDMLGQRIDAPDTHIDIALLRAQGQLPHGDFGSLAVAGIEAEAEALANVIRPTLKGAIERELDLSLPDGTRLTGRLKHIGRDAMVRFQAGKPNARGQLAMWIDHLALNALDDIPSKTTRWIAQGSDESYVPVADAMTRLGELVRLYRAGRTRPLPLFPDCAAAYADKAHDPTSALIAAEQHWLGGEWVRAESERPANAFAFRDRDPLRDDSGEFGFEALALTVFKPILDAKAAKPGKRKS
ncbi:MAG: exodeoxyribonuclease V subunit gamma [Gammaproteobacteria bacterium]|nr:exodeoxyribonuclease V subunit gamma [Gammaproteobacteria bacterium]MCP5137772.1 exodeoxyribonuclease V subunit gamma [Gammaproteobacteria bacterium]